MTDEIEKKFATYKYIYEKILPKFYGTEELEITKTLLENSLYLSVFTTFEDFLKKLIDNYVYNIEKKGVKLTNLTNRIAHKIFLSKKDQLKYIIEKEDSNRNKSFDNFFDFLTQNIDKETLKNHIRFEFLHKDKLNGHYKNLFGEILGEREFLHKISITQSTSFFGENFSQEVKSDAATFLFEFTDKIRNNIAHEMEKFKIQNYSFLEIVNAFSQIISEINKMYKEHTGFILEQKIENNILEDY